MLSVELLGVEVQRNRVGGRWEEGGRTWRKVGGGEEGGDRVSVPVPVLLDSSKRVRRVEFMLDLDFRWGTEDETPAA